MKTITVQRDGRPATREELQAAVEGLPLPSVRSDDLLADAIRRMDDVRGLMHAAYVGGMTLERAGHVATAYSLAMRVQEELTTANKGIARK